MGYYEDVKEAAEYIRARIAKVPELAIVLGSGLGDFAGTLGDAVSLPYGELPHWPASKVIGHEGRLVIGTVGGRTIAALSGRCHVYEGHDLKTVTFAVRALGLLGVKMLVLTNAAGGINTGFSSGALMVIDDHINLIGGNPLVGPNDERFGVRFPDMSEVYSKRLRAVADAGAKAMGMELPHGIYVGLLGPSYETPAEIRMLAKMGADAVGMSTVAEALAARACGARVAGISLITNQAAGISGERLSHEEVIAAGREAAGRFSDLLEHAAASLAR